MLRRASVRTILLRVAANNATKEVSVQFFQNSTSKKKKKKKEKNKKKKVKRIPESFDARSFAKFEILNSQLLILTIESAINFRRRVLIALRRSPHTRARRGVQSPSRLPFPSLSREPSPSTSSAFLPARARPLCTVVKSWPGGQKRSPRAQRLS
ncbi:hypothetical protein PUN28_013560 [Cardiocondyla obscurior]|uniref:Uncharacterized protein n=1 Tax=Cardiocondyla obscurior TaxID=286306 RepID=A0AAW2F5U0_9HYME